jgi:polyribonucleotide nucleotidyltransferase
MFNIHKKEIDFGGRTLSLETGKIARQAEGAVFAKYGETTVLAAATAAKKPKDGVDFFPLTVHYQEKYYAAGRIPGGFLKRENRPSEKETLTSRLIDRPIRPLFAEGFYNEVQVIATTMTHDMINDPDVIAIIASSAALAISGVPFSAPIGAARVGYIGGAYVLNPTIQQMEESSLDLVVAGTREGILMVESMASELSEEIMLGAVMFGWKGFQPIIEAIEQLAKAAGKPRWDAPTISPEKKALKAEMKTLVGADLTNAFAQKDKATRRNLIDEAMAKVKAQFATESWTAKGIDTMTISKTFKEIESDIVRGNILKGTRIDGRNTTTVRPILAEAGILPRVHGSALFTRGETQAIVVTTLGTGQDEQIIDAIEGEYRENFMLHYNFPPYSVGEAGRMGAPGRREIGHGKLAWRAIRPLLPSKEAFPYTLRVVSEITESNGSSSMATVCGTSLALMDAGVPLARPIAGIAMGLIKEANGEFAVLTDILGDEDHLGDMDFKVAGTEAGITALQMDLKIDSVSEAIMKQALAQAKDGRLHILGEMAKGLSEARSELNATAPRITSFKINPDKIREVIGTGGKVIREITETTGTKIDIEDDGTIKIASTEEEAAKKAYDWIMGIAGDPELGKVYEGTVVKIMDFGAFVNFMGSKDGLVHISQIINERVSTVRDHLQEGQKVKVKVLGFDDRGKVKLSMKEVNQETGEDLGPQPRPEGEEPQGDRPERSERPRREGGDRGGRGGDRGGRGERREGRGDRRDGDRPRRDRDDRGGDKPQQPKTEASNEETADDLPSFLSR